MADSLFQRSPEDEIESRVGGSSDEDGETMTAAEVLEKLEEAWINEKFAPDLLDYKTDEVGCILLQIQEMEENLTQVEKGDFVAKLQKMELDRVRYILCSYLRTRLKKIEKYVSHILESCYANDTHTLLSPEELAYAKEYADNLDTHYDSLLLSHMPSNFKKIDKKKAVRRPNLEQYVFVKALEKKNQVLIDPEEDGAEREAIDLLPGNQFILRYHPISSLIRSGEAQLI